MMPKSLRKMGQPQSGRRRQQGRAVQNLMGGHRPIWGSKFFFDSAPANASERSERSVSGCKTGGPGGGSPLAGVWGRSPQKNFENKVFKDSRKIDLQHTLPKNFELVKKTFIL